MKLFEILFRSARSAAVLLTITALVLVNGISTIPLMPGCAKQTANEGYQRAVAPQQPENPPRTTKPDFPQNCETTARRHTPLIEFLALTRRMIL